MKILYFTIVALTLCVAGMGLYIFKQSKNKSCAAQVSVIPAANRGTENILDAIDSLGNALKHNIDVLMQANQPDQDFEQIKLRVFK
ncbi:MAG: hypothetical protein P4M14_12435, partial [Gammaproteobacteria bacterium]|nr:hypothetical protein [Gammaproteobacteria bacterium]